MDSISKLPLPQLTEDVSGLAAEYMDYTINANKLILHKSKNTAIFLAGLTYCRAGNF